jgi:hypothetical protein
VTINVDCRPAGRIAEKLRVEQSRPYGGNRPQWGGGEIGLDKPDPFVSAAIRCAHTEMEGRGRRDRSRRRALMKS